MQLEPALKRTFLFILASTLVFAGVMLQLKWNDIRQEAFTKLEYTNSLVQTSMDAVLNHQETVLTVLGKRLMELRVNHQQARAKDLIDDMLAQNPGLVGFGLADLTGNYLLVSSNLETMKLPNLLEQPESAISFRKALASDDMVLGRTYFFKPANGWVIPARLRLLDENDKPIAVMTTGFIYDAPESPWNDVVLPESVRMLIVRPEADRYYRQFISGIPDDKLSQWIDSPVDAETTKRFTQDLYNDNKVTLEDVKLAQRIFKTESVDKNKNKSLATIQYDTDYDLFTIIIQQKDSLYPQLIPSLAWLGILLVTFNVALYVLFYAITRIQINSRKTLEFQATHDALTELPNRHFLNSMGDSWKREWKRKAALIFVDMNNFKATNDFYGHRMGDSLLKVIAQRLKQSFEGDIVIRLGGDEFIILTRDHSTEALESKAQSFLENLKQTIELNDIDFNLYASIGISRFPEDGGDVDELLRKADIAMYDAKRRKLPFQLFSKEIDEKNKRRQLIEKAIPGALDNNEFSLVYQPQIDAGSGKIIGIETLIRWQSEKLGFVPPDEFICIAETSGTINEIGHFVLKQSVQEINEICASFDKLNKNEIFQNDHLRLALNVSVQQLFHDDFSNQVELILQKSNRRHINMMIEITESLFIDNIHRATEILHDIKAKGVKVSLDDFGTGYSSLSILSQLPIDELKIDKSFVHSMLQDEKYRLLIQSIISIGKNLNIPLLAEGVEEWSEASLLKEYGCDAFQGYCFAKPMPREELVAFIQAYRPESLYA